MLRNCESISYPRSSSFCVGQNSLPCLHDFVFVRIYWTILIHSTLLHPVSLIQISIRYYRSMHIMSFAGVLIDDLHKTSVKGFVIPRACYVASILFNILMNKLWKFSVWLEFITRNHRSDAVRNFGLSFVLTNGLLKECSKTTFNYPYIKVFFSCSRTL